MTGPCLEDTETIALSLDGLNLIADVRNPSSSFSATQGDDTTHVVTDADVPHIQTQTVVINNTGSARTKGIIVVALNPIWAGLPDGPISLIWEASLTIAAVLADQRDTVTQAMVENEIVQFSPGALVGQIDIGPGGSVSVTWEKRITNDGASAQWSYRMGGDKLVANLGY